VLDPCLLVFKINQFSQEIVLEDYVFDDFILEITSLLTKLTSD